MKAILLFIVTAVLAVAAVWLWGTGDAEATIAQCRIAAEDQIQDGALRPSRIMLCMRAKGYTFQGPSENQQMDPCWGGTFDPYYLAEECWHTNKLMAQIATDRQNVFEHKLEKAHEKHNVPSVP
jgi:hypothetical protein